MQIYSLLNFNTNDLHKVKMGRPWCFDRNLFSLNMFNGSYPPKTIPFRHEPMWIQIYNMPLNGMIYETSKHIGGLIGEVENVDMDKDKIAWGLFLRVQVMVDIIKPLIRGMVVKTEGN